MSKILKLVHHDTQNYHDTQYTSPILHITSTYALFKSILWLVDTGK